MVGSLDSVDFAPDLFLTEETNVILLDCWQNPCLSKIWIPKNLLPSRQKPTSTLATQGVFHTLEKKGHSKCIESFSIYSDSDSESNQEIFLSDSDEDALELHRNECDDTENFSVVKSLPSINDLSKIGEDCESFINSFEKNINSKLKQYKTNDLPVKIFQKDANSVPQNTFEIFDNSHKFDKELIYLFAEEAKLKKVNSDRKENLNVVDDKPREHKNFSNSFEKIKNNKTLKQFKTNLSIENFQKNDSSVPQSKFESNKFDKELIKTDYEFDEESKVRKVVNSDKNVKLNIPNDNLRDSNISLNEILDVTPDVSVCDFPFRIGNKYSTGQDEKVELDKKRIKKDKKKKKAAKSIKLDEFLEDYTEEDKQDAYCNDYLQKILLERRKEEVQWKNTSEFPDLKPKSVQYIYSTKSESKILGINLESVIENLTKSDELNCNVNNTIKTEPCAPEIASCLGKIVIENIPLHVCDGDILEILRGYGEIKDFVLKHDGEFLKAFVEIDLICETEWIIECLNETEPFGASSRMLKCYKQE